MKKNDVVTAGFVSAILAFSIVYATALVAQDEVVEISGIDSSRLEALAKFTKVLSLTEKYYVDEKEMQELMDTAIDGLMSKLDAHSAYLNKNSFANMKVQTKGEFGGLGITVGIRDGALTIIAPIEGTPADRAGLMSGDIILKIEQKTTIGITIDEAVGLMRGKPDTPISITIVRKGEPKPFEVNIIRDIIKIESVYTKSISGNISYLRVTNFDRKVTDEIAKAIRERDDESIGYILDLRNNPGGLLDQAVGVVDLFVDEGVIVSQKGRDTRDNSDFRASKSKTVTDKPLVVLINEGSASASEIVSGALQDHKRAVLVGQKSFGKGSVQVVLPISETEAVKLTVARYYLPSGRTIQAVGVTPDIEVARGKVPTQQESAFAIKEADLKLHLEQELKKIDANTTESDESNSTDSTLITPKQLAEDIQLKEAVDIIKALDIIIGGR